MSDLHLAEIKSDPIQQVGIFDPEPLQSAVLFKYISDEIWKEKPDDSQDAEYGLVSVLPSIEALGVAANALNSVDKNLIITNKKEGLRITGPYNGEKQFDPEFFKHPSNASITTYNWDQLWDKRLILVDGQRTYAHFTDGHMDYARELSANFTFACIEKGRKERLVLSYTLQRYQTRQDQTISIGSKVWFSKFGATGYEGNELQYVDVSQSQETKLLLAFAAIGGIAVDSLFENNN